MESDSAPDPLPRVDDSFHSRFGVELAAEDIRRRSVDSFAMIVAALEASYKTEVTAVLSAPPNDILTARGRAQHAYEILDRFKNHEARMKKAARIRATNQAATAGGVP